MFRHAESSVGVEKEHPVDSDYVGTCQRRNNSFSEAFSGNASIKIISNPANKERLTRLFGSLDKHLGVTVD